MIDLRKAAANLRVWPDAYHMGAHDRNVCMVVADALVDEVEQLRKDNKLLVACVKTSLKYSRIKNPEAALIYLVRKLRKAERSD